MQTCILLSQFLFAVLVGAAVFGFCVHGCPSFSFCFWDLVLFIDKSDAILICF